MVWESGETKINDFHDCPLKEDSGFEVKHLSVLQNDSILYKNVPVLWAKSKISWSTTDLVQENSFFKSLPQLHYQNYNYIGTKEILWFSVQVLCCFYVIVNS